MSRTSQAPWPELPTAAWRDTYETLHLWTQIVGKIRLARTPWLNHSWHVTLYVTARGLTTSPIPMARAASRSISISSIMCLWLRTSDGARGSSAAGRTIGRRVSTPLMAALRDLGIDVAHRRRCRTRSPDADPVPAGQRACLLRSATRARRFWRMLCRPTACSSNSAPAFLGKASPVHFFWGSFDLAVTRFSGRRAPRHPGGVPHLPDAVALRSLFARGEQRRLLAGRRRDRLSGVLLLCLSRAGRLCAAKVRPGAAFFSKRWANSSCPMTPCAPPRAGAGAARIPAKHLRGRGGFRQMGPRRAGMRAGPARAWCGRFNFFARGRLPGCGYARRDARLSRYRR